MAEETDEVGQPAADERVPTIDADRDNAVLDIAYEISLEEVKQVNGLLQATKGRIGTFFGAALAAVSFLLGSTLGGRDPESLDYEFLYIGIGAFILFAIATYFGMSPTRRGLYLDGKKVMDKFVKGNQTDSSISYRRPVNIVKWQLIHKADDLVEKNVKALSRVQFWYRAMLVTAAAAITAFALLLAYSAPAGTVAG